MWVRIFKTLQFFMYSSKPPNVCPAFPRWDGDVLKYSIKYFVYYPQGWFCRDRRGHWQSRSWQSELDSGRISTAQPPDKAGLITWENTDNLTNSKTWLNEEFYEPGTIERTASSLLRSPLSCLRWLNWASSPTWTEWRQLSKDTSVISLVSSGWVGRKLEWHSS